MTIIRKVQAHAVEIVIVMLILTIGLAGYIAYALQGLRTDITNMQSSLNDVNTDVNDLTTRPAYSSPENTLTDIQATLNELQDQMDEIDSTVFDIKYGLR